MADDDSIESLFACQAESDAGSDTDSAPQIISRDDAIALGFVTYFTGKPCKYGHVAERYVSCKRCVCCSIAYRADHKEAIKAYYVDNKEAIAEQKKAYRADNTIAEREKAYRADNKEHKNVYIKQRRQIDIQYWLSINLRNRLSQAIKNDYKSGSAVRDLGCTIEFLKQHLERQFVEGMTWENRGKVWHIDHIEPLCSFDLEDREQLLIVCHYTNLRPLFKEDNFKKIAEDKKKRFKYEVDPNYSCLIELDLLEDERQGNQQNE